MVLLLSLDGQQAVVLTSHDSALTGCNTPSTPGPAVLTPGSSLGSYIVPQTNVGLLCALCPHSCAPEKTSRSVTYPKLLQAKHT
jgi:hypothetical protein